MQIYAVLLNFLLIKEFWGGQKIIVSNFHEDTKNDTWTSHVSWVANQHIWMITRASRDTQDWSNNAESSINHFKIHY